MSVCPKCGHKLHFYNASQFCPNCGVNMRFYNFEDNFYLQAKKAELGFADLHVKVRRFKAAMIGSPLAIARLCVMLIPLLSVLIPAASAVLKLPFRTAELSLGGIGIYGMFTDTTLAFIGQMKGSSADGAAFGALLIALYAQLGAAVLAVLVFLTSLLNFISLKNMPKIITAVCSAGILCTGADIILYARAASIASSGTGAVSCKIGLGLFVTLLCFAGVLVVEILILKKGIPVKYEEGDLERAEIAHKVKSGELKLEDLPQPVVETAETRRIDEEIHKEEDAYLRRKAEEAEEAAQTGSAADGEDETGSAGGEKQENAQKAGKTDGGQAAADKAAGTEDAEGEDK